MSGGVPTASQWVQTIPVGGLVSPFSPPYAGTPSPSGITGYVVPGLGKGFLRFYADIGNLNDGQLDLTFLSDEPWHYTGWQPFAWDVLPPTADRVYPIIRLVLARSVELQTEVRASKNSPLQMKSGGERSPFIQIFRPQDDSLIPQPGERIEEFRFLPAPFRVSPLPSYQDQHGHLHEFPIPEYDITSHRILEDLSPFMLDVRTSPLGVEIRNVNGRYGLTIGVDAKKRGAYTYELQVSKYTKLVRVRVMYTDGVRLAAFGDKDAPSLFKVEVGKVYSTDNVPRQGASLDDFEGYFSPLKIEFEPEQRPVWTFLLELAIGFVPYVGALYLASQVAYGVITGKDFYGHHVSDGDLWIMGIAAVLPVALSRAPGAVPALVTELKASPLARALDEGVTREIQRVMETEFLVAVGKIEAKDATGIGRLLTLFVSGKRTPSEILQAFDKLVNKQYLTEINKRIAKQALTADYRTFRNANLASGFNQYAIKKGATKTRSVIEWALAQRTGNYIPELERELGTEWRKILQSARHDPLLNSNFLSTKEIAHYDSLAARIDDYASLTKANKGHGDFFEVDHVCEQRFWRNDPRIASAFAEKPLGMAMLVPKNPAVSARIPGKPMAYVHTTKTKMLADLIPNGREAEFTAQQIWDAHSFTLQALKVDRDVILHERVTSNFSMLARTRGEPPLNFRIVTIDRSNYDFFFLPPYWPIFPVPKS
jgi:hypothetical protein